MVYEGLQIFLYISLVKVRQADGYPSYCAQLFGSSCSADVSPAETFDDDGARIADIIFSVCVGEVVESH